LTNPLARQVAEEWSQSSCRGLPDGPAAIGIDLREILAEGADILEDGVDIAARLSSP
jgi:hypothetical protein